MLWLDDNSAPWTMKIFDGSDWIAIANIDPSSNVFTPIGMAAARAFAPRANDTPDLRVRLEAGVVFDAVSQGLGAVASQQTASLTAPTNNPRKDIVYIDRTTGIVGVVAGVEAASPVDPAIPSGKLPVARINWAANSPSVTNSMLDDVRALNALGLGALATFNAITDLPDSLSISGDISPSQITANQNDYDPAGLSAASTLRLSSDASRDITGIAGGADGRLLILYNIGSNNIVLRDENAGSSAANRFALSGDITLGVDQAAILQYDSSSSRWRMIAGSAISGSTVNAIAVSTFTASGTYTKPAGLKYAQVVVVGGGGGGGAGNGGGAGGGSGGTAMKLIAGASIGATESITVGSGGGSGSGGGTSSFGSHCSASGGSAGAGVGGEGGAAGVGSNGDQNIKGGAGDHGGDPNGYWGGGTGGSSTHGGGGKGRISGVDSTGDAGGNYGGGGGGGTGSFGSGGAGAAGIVIVTSYS